LIESEALHFYTPIELFTKQIYLVSV